MSDDLEAQIYQPGVWRCAKCGFRLVQSNLNASTGTVSARNDPGDKCPNDGSPLWRVTWREDAEDAVKWGSEQFDLRAAADDALTAALAEVKHLREELQQAAEDFTRIHDYCVGLQGVKELNHVWAISGDSKDHFHGVLAALTQQSQAGGGE